jgi:hypothetical protein
MFLWAKYGTQTSFRFPVVKRGVVDLAATADWTPATGDTKVSKDGGNVANSTNNPGAIGGTGSVSWTLTLSATELTAAEVNIQIVDSATKAIEDQYLTVYTYGHASAKIQTDLSLIFLTAAQVNAEVVDALAVDIIADSVPADGTRPTVTQALYMLTQFMLERSVSGTTLTVKKPDGSTTLLTLTLNDATTPTTITRAT